MHGAPPYIQPRLISNTARGLRRKVKKTAISFFICQNKKSTLKSPLNDRASVGRYKAWEDNW